MNSDFLMHYGIKGMKWGVRRTPEQLGHVNIPKKSLHRNLDKFGLTPKTNVLYIMGSSGSGKSTVARNNMNRRTNVIHLDAYIDNSGAPKSKDFNAFLQKHGWKSTDAHAAIKNGRWDKIDDFEKLIDKFGEEQFKNNKRVICEGVQLMDNTLHPNKSYFKSKPYVILTTSALVSTFRANNRDSARFNLIRDIKGDIRRIKLMNELKRKMGY